MVLFLTILLTAVGLVLIIKGGDWFVDSASWIAEKTGIPKLIVGATVVSFATTLPELLVSCLAGIRGNSDMAIGNAVGSVSANIGLIMGISLICIPAVIRRKDYALKGGLMIGAAALLAGLTLLGINHGYTEGGDMPAAYLHALPALSLFVIFGVAMWDNIRGALSAMKNEKAASGEKTPTTKKEIVLNIVKFVIGVAGIVGGAELLVTYGSKLATLIGVPERIISITMVAIGTSLPELVTTVTAIVKKQSQLSVGNIIGANIIDLTLILPICALLSGGRLTVPTPGSYLLDMPFTFLAAVVAIVPAMIGKKFYRAQGIALLLLYAGYITISCLI